MSLPNFLAPSPPRSPHVAAPSYIHSYFSQTPPSRSTPHSFFRPTRRDLLLCLLTLSLSYLLFTPPPTPRTLIPVQKISHRPKSAGSSYSLPSWAIWRHTEELPVECPSKEVTFGESVQTYGLGGDVVGSLDPDQYPGSQGHRWDGGEEEAEDDELEGKSTILLGHQPGWTIVERLYLYNGSWYIITDERSDWPELRLMTSTGLPANNEPGNSEAREPNGDEILFVTPYEAARLWGPRVYKMDGMTWLFNDGQFIDHYYHFAAELLLGSWRTYATLDPDITPQGETKLPPPRRIWFLHQGVDEWRDGPRFNSMILFNTLPSTTYLYPNDFADLKNVTVSNRPSAFVVEKAILVDRSAAFRGPWTVPTSRTVASALRIGKTSRWWWEPMRRQMLRYSGVSEEVLARSLEGFGAVDPSTFENPILAGPGVSDLEPLMPPGKYRPVVTYISRQSSRRHLTVASHMDLVQALEDRAKKLDFELVIVEAEKLSKEEQFALAARTTILLGVHGNGLTHLIWMPATPRSAVIEIFFVGGFARDYQWTAHALGIRHFAVQHDTTFTAPNLPQVAYPVGFQGESITVVGKVVADLVEDRLAGKA